MKFTASTHLTPGEDLLAAVIASRWNPDRLAEIPALVTKTDLDDWARVITWHGLAGIITKLHQPALAELPEDFARVPAQIHARHVPRALQQFKVLADVHRILNDAGVPHMPLKGLFLSLQLYGDIATRVSTDLDVLIDPTDFDHAAIALKSAGYRCAIPYLLSGAVRELTIRSVYDIPWASSAGALLELHTRTDRSMSLSLMSLHRLSNLERRSFGPVSVKLLAGSALTEYLAVHAVRSQCSAWKWGYDVIGLIEKANGSAKRWFEIVQTESWALSLCLEIMRQQLGEGRGTSVPRRETKAAHFIGALGVNQRAAKVSWPGGEAFNKTVASRIEVNVAELLRHGRLGERIRFIWQTLLRYHPEGSPVVLRLVAMMPVLAPLVRAFRWLSLPWRAAANSKDMTEHD